jgi:hypothetical protein
MKNETSEIRNIAVEMAEVLKKYNITYKDAREVLIMLSKIIDRTIINSDSLNIKMECDTPIRGHWLSEQASSKN